MPTNPPDTRAPKLLTNEAQWFAPILITGVVLLGQPLEALSQGTDVAVLSVAVADAIPPPPSATLPTLQDCSINKTAPMMKAAVSPLQSEADQVQYLELGALYERLNDTEAAIKAYESALSSNNKDVWQCAIKAIERLRGKSSKEKVLSFIYDHSVKYMQLLGTFALYLFLVLLTITLLAVVAKMVRWIRWLLGKRPRLEILAFSTGDASKAGSTAFEDVVVFMMHKMRRQTELGKHLTPNSSVLPEMRSRSLFEHASEIAISLVPKARPLIEWFLRKVNEPEYLVEGSTLIGDRWHHIIVRLKYEGKIRQTWSESFRSKDALDRLKDLAYDLIQSTKRIR
jgi:tetratricopeptide (TPR) repeat protein